MRELVSIFIILLLLAIVGSVFLQQAETISISDVVEEITPPSIPYRIAVDSTYGHIYYGDENGHIWKSTDEGTTWTEIYTEFHGKATNLLVFDGNDNLFLQVAVNKTIMKSTDYGQTFQSVSSQLEGQLWHFSEASNGSLYMQVYATPHPYVYKSNDNGDLWTRYFNMTEHYWGHLVDHLHVFASNPYNDECYVGSGDGFAGNTTLWRYTDLTGWSILWNLTQYYKYNYNPTAIWFDETYVYFGSDGGRDFISRIPHKGNITEDWCGLLRRDEWPGNLDFATQGIYHEGVHVVTTQRGRIFASFDGEHWVCLRSSGQTIRALAKKTSKGNSFWTCDPGNGKIIRITIDAQVIAHLFYSPYTTLSDSTVTFETEIRHGTSYIDLSQYLVSNAKIMFQGVHFKNLVTNGSFETGVKIVSGAQHGSNDGGWWDRYGNLYQVAGGHEGDYCLMCNTSTCATDIHPLEFHEHPFSLGWKEKLGDVYTIDFWVRGNFSTSPGEWAGAIIFHWKGATSDDVESTKFLATTEWNHIWWAQIIPTWATHVSFCLQVYDRPFKCYFDEITFTYHNDTVYDSGGLGRQAVHSARIPNTWINDTAQTTDLSVWIGSQTFEYSGTLPHDDRTQEWDLHQNGGIIKVSVSVTGSCMVKIYVEATKSSQISKGILRNQLAAGLFNGTCYGTTAFDNTTLNLVILAQKQTRIASASLTSKKLTFIVSGYSGLSSMTEVYCDDRGEPVAIYSVNGTLTWNYNVSDKKLTLEITHESPTKILVYWMLPGDIDGDGDVDGFDLTRICGVYGSTQEDPEWDEACDIDGNGLIDGFDLTQACGNYGKSLS